MPDVKVDEKPKYEPGKKYTIKARSSVQLLSIGTILHHPDTYTGVLDEAQLKEVLKSVSIGALTLEAVKESEQEKPKKEVPKPVKKEEPKKGSGWKDKEVPKKVTETAKPPLENAEVDKAKAEVNEGAAEVKSAAVPEKEEKKDEND